ncbi:fasciclin domain-containing protein [bacterium]|nr:fasciclin domain-containing protein [bacterium]
MKLLQNVAGVACLAVGLSLVVPQKADAQSRRRQSPSRTLNLVERLDGLKQYSTLVTAVTEAGLGDALAEIDQATIFAPTNAAFEKIPAESLSALLADKDALTNLLTYHVVPGERLSSFRLGNRSLTTLNEGSLAVKTSRHRSFWWFSSTVKVNDSKVVQANIGATNGIIHGIDTVLDPDFMAPKSILDLANGTESLSILATLVESAGLDRALDSDRLELTVFAPTNEAFSKLPAEVLEAVQNDRELLRFVLRNHIVRGSVQSSDLETGPVRTVARTDLDVVVGEEEITVGPATVVGPDVLASNGVVHVIDEVLVPETIETLVGVINSRDELATFKVALDTAGFTRFFDQRSRFWKWTIFAPDNDAFGAIPADALGALLEDKRALRGVLLRHVAFGKTTSGDLADGGVVRTIGGRLAIGISDEGVTFNGTPLVEADLDASNGVIHIVGGVIPESTPEVEEGDDDADEG